VPLAAIKVVFGKDADLISTHASVSSGEAEV
jgi:hypothetical protein